MGHEFFGSTLGDFIGVTLVLFGGAAFMTGQALAGTWRPLWQIVPYGLLLAAADRFFSWGLFDGRAAVAVGVHHRCRDHHRDRLPRLPPHARPQDDHAIPMALRARRPVRLAGARRRRPRMIEVARHGRVVLDSGQVTRPQPQGCPGLNGAVPGLPSCQ